MRGWSATPSAAVPRCTAMVRHVPNRLAGHWRPGLPMFRRMENRRFDLTIAATSIAFLLVQLDVSIINVALATIGTRLQAGVSGLQWIVDAYAVTFAALLLSAGGLGDR